MAEKCHMCWQHCMLLNIVERMAHAYCLLTTCWPHSMQALTIVKLEHCGRAVITLCLQPATLLNSTVQLQILLVCRRKVCKKAFATS